VTLRLLEDDAVAEPGSDGLRAVRPETPVRRPSDLDGVGVEVPGSSTSVGAASRFARAAAPYGAGGPADPLQGAWLGRSPSSESTVAPSSSSSSRSRFARDSRRSRSRRINALASS